MSNMPENAFDSKFSCTLVSSQVSTSLATLIKYNLQFQCCFHEARPVSTHKHSFLGRHSSHTVCCVQSAVSQHRCLMRTADETLLMRMLASPLVLPRSGPLSFSSWERFCPDKHTFYDFSSRLSCGRNLFPNTKGCCFTRFNWLLS